MDISLNKYDKSCSLEEMEQLEKKLLSSGFTLTEAGISESQIAGWKDQGLLTDFAETGRLKFVEYVWLKIISELQSMYVPDEHILRLKEGLFTTIPARWIYQLMALNPELLERLPNESVREQIKGWIDNKEYEKVEPDEGYPYLFFVVLNAILVRVPVYILLFREGEWMSWSDDSPDSIIEKFEPFLIPGRQRKTFETHLSVSISSIIKDFLAENAIQAQQLHLLGETDQKVLNIIHSGEYESISIQFKNKRMRSMELVKKQDVKRKIVDILSENTYQDILIKRHNGTVTKIQNTIKVTF
jgi:hypothetical protein